MPPTIEDYQRNPERVLIDIATDPVFKQFIDSSDLELVAVDLGDGTQKQTQALKQGSVRQVIDRIVTRGLRVGVDIKDLICSPIEFDLCSKLDSPVGEQMRFLNDFFNDKWAQGGVHAAGLIALFTAPYLGTALTILSVLGWVNGVFVELCDCPKCA